MPAKITGYTVVCKLAIPTYSEHEKTCMCAVRMAKKGVWVEDGGLLHNK